MIKVGIAGYSGSGKSSLVKYISDKKKIYLIDLDVEAKLLMNQSAEIRSKIDTCFGKKIFIGNQINFTALGKVSFSSIENLIKLNSIVHPKLLEYLNSELSKSRDEIIVVDAALIPYWQIEKWFDILIWISSKSKIRIKRLVSRNNVSEDITAHRVELQQALFSEPTNNSWIILDNNNTLDIFYNNYSKLGV